MSSCQRHPGTRERAEHAVSLEPIGSAASERPPRGAAHIRAPQLGAPREWWRNPGMQLRTEGHLPSTRPCISLGAWTPRAGRAHRANHPGHQPAQAAVRPRPDRIGTVLQSTMHWSPGGSPRKPPPSSTAAACGESLHRKFEDRATATTPNRRRPWPRRCRRSADTAASAQRVLEISVPAPFAASAVPPTPEVAAAQEST